MSIIKKDSNSNITGNIRFGTKVPKLFSAVRQSTEQATKLEDAAATMPNRIALMLDSSGSMSDRVQHNKSKIDYLKDAVAGFLDAVNFNDTSIALCTFGASPEVNTGLTCQKDLLNTMTLQLAATGGTPLHACMEGVIGSLSLTRAVVISDGEAGDWRHDVPDCPPVSCIPGYIEMGVPVDCVHIGNGSGAELLQEIAQRTGGIFIAFKDITNFAKSLKYLTPKFRAMLTAMGSEARKMLGADEVK